MKLYRNWIINKVARAGEHTNERTYELTYIRTGQTLYPSTTLLCEGIIKVWTLLIYRAFSEINRYNHPYQIISKTVKYQSFVINIINLLGALYLISINLFLILISKLVPLTLELARTLNMFIRLQVMLLRAI